MNVLLAFVLFAQIFSPARAYTTADPVSPERLGLATLTGRYMVELDPQGCDYITADMNVEVTATDDTSALLDYTCVVWIVQQMSSTPCFQIDGVCDVNGE